MRNCLNNKQLGPESTNLAILLPLGSNPIKQSLVWGIFHEFWQFQNEFPMSSGYFYGISNQNNPFLTKIKPFYPKSGLYKALGP